MTNDKNISYENVLKHSKDNVIVEISSKQTSIQNIVPPTRQKETKKE